MGERIATPPRPTVPQQAGGAVAGLRPRHWNCLFEGDRDFQGVATKPCVPSPSVKKPEI
jgi:hypothetical protein